MKKEQARIWYIKGFEDAETAERQPVTLEQTMRDAETHFHLVWDANATLREQPAPPAIEWKSGPPDKEGKYLIAIHSWYGKDVVEMYWFVRDNPMSAEKLKKVAFHAAWPQYPDRV